MNKLAAALLFLTVPLVAFAQIKVTSSPGHIVVSVDGQPVTFSGVGPQRIGGRVLVPLRGVMEKIGATVTWEASTKTVRAKKDENSLSLIVGASVAMVNNSSVTLDVPATILSGTTLVPLRFMGEALGSPVIYEEVPSASNADLVGVWYLLDSNDAFVKSTKITFSGNRTFLFQGSAWKSTGTFDYVAGQVTLVWTSVDGQAVKPGSMTKTLPVTEGATRMQLDRFRYGKF